LSAAGAGAGAGAATAAASPAANADAGEPAAAGNAVTFDTSDAALDGKRLGAFPFPVVSPERNSASDSTKSLSATILTHKSDPSIDEDAVLIAADDGRSVLEYKKDDKELQRLVHAAARTPDPNAADPKAQARFIVRSGRKFVGTLLGSGKIFEAPAGELRRPLQVSRHRVGDRGLHSPQRLRRQDPAAAFLRARLLPGQNN